MSVARVGTLRWQVTGNQTISGDWNYLQGRAGSWANEHWTIVRPPNLNGVTTAVVDMGLNSPAALARDMDSLTLSNGNFAPTSRWVLALHGVEHVNAPLNQTVHLTVSSGGGFTTNGSLTSIRTNVGNHEMQYTGATRDSTLFTGVGWDRVRLIDHPDVSGTQYWALIRREHGQVDAYSLESGFRIRMEGGGTTWGNTNGRINYGEVDEIYLAARNRPAGDMFNPGQNIGNTGDRGSFDNIDLSNAGLTAYTDRFEAASFKSIHYASQNVHVGTAIIQTFITDTGGGLQSASRDHISTRSGNHHLLVNEETMAVDGHLRLYVRDNNSGLYNRFNEVYLGTSGNDVDANDYSTTSKNAYATGAFTVAQAAINGAGGVLTVNRPNHGMQTGEAVTFTSGFRADNFQYSANTAYTVTRINDGQFSITSSVSSVGPNTTPTNVTFSVKVLGTAMYGFGGNDILTGGADTDYLFGGTSTYTTISAGFQGNIVTGGAGGDFFGVGNISHGLDGDAIMTTNFTSRLAGTAPANNTPTGQLARTGAAETADLSTRVATDRIQDWTAGVDSLRVLANGTAVIDGLGTTNGAGGAYSLDPIGGDAERIDVSGGLVNNQGKIVARGLGGNDTIIGSGGADWLYGNVGDNLVVAGIATPAPVVTGHFVSYLSGKPDVAPPSWGSSGPWTGRYVYELLVTGGVAGSVWGDASAYTGDSNLGAAAVHAGVLTAGQTARVYVEALPSQTSFVDGALSNGVNPLGFGQYPTAFRFVTQAALTEPNVVFHADSHDGNDRIYYDNYAGRLFAAGFDSGDKIYLNKAVLEAIAGTFFRGTEAANNLTANATTLSGTLLLDTADYAAAVAYNPRINFLHDSFYGPSGGLPTNSQHTNGPGFVDGSDHYADSSTGIIGGGMFAAGMALNFFLPGAGYALMAAGTALGAGAVAGSLGWTTAHQHATYTGDIRGNFLTVLTAQNNVDTTAAVAGNANIDNRSFIDFFASANAGDGFTPGVQFASLPSGTTINQFMAVHSDEETFIYWVYSRDDTVVTAGEAIKIAEINGRLFAEDFAIYDGALDVYNHGTLTPIVIYTPSITSVGYDLNRDGDVTDAGIDTARIAEKSAVVLSGGGQFVLEGQFFRTLGDQSNPFTTTANSATVTVAYNGHGLTNGNWIQISGATPANGIDFNGAYQIANVTANGFTITANKFIGDPNNPSVTGLAAVSGGSAGGNVSFGTPGSISAGSTIKVYDGVDRLDANAPLTPLVNDVFASVSGNGFTLIDTRALGTSITQSPDGVVTFRAGGYRDAQGNVASLSITDGSDIVTVAYTAHGMQVGNTVSIVGATAAGGVDFNGTWVVTSITTNTFTFTAEDIASDTLTVGTDFSFTSISAPVTVAQAGITGAAGVLTVTMANHGMLSGDEVTFSSTFRAGNFLYSANTGYTVTRIDDTRFSITSQALSPGLDSTPANVTFSVPNGGDQTFFLRDERVSYFVEVTNADTGFETMSLQYDFTVGGGNGTLNGGRGSDTLILSDESAALNVMTDSQIVHLETITLTNEAPDTALLNLSNQTDGFTIYDSGAGNTIIGSRGNDAIHGQGGDDSLNGHDGNDTIHGFVGADTVDGGAGTDTLALTGTSTDLNAAANTQLVNVEAVTAATATAGVDLNLLSQTEGLTVVGSSHADTITGGSGHDTITGGAGNDSINAGLGTNSVTDAGNGADVITHNSPGSTVAIAVTGTGTVTLTAFQVGATANSADLVNTTVNASTSTAVVTLNGGNGNDSLVGGDGADTINGGAGADTLIGGNGNDVLNGNEGSDTITGGNGADVINAGTGLGTITDAGQGADMITHNSAGQVAIAVTGTDTVTLTASSIHATANSAVGVNTTVNASPSTAAVRLNGNTGDDSLTGGNGADTITGGDGADTIGGRLGNDIIVGGDGLNILYGDEGADTITGGADADRIHGGDDADSIVGGDGNDTIYGENGSDIIVGDGGADTIYGDAGSDTITGGAGADRMHGGDDADSIVGGDGNDTIFGDGGNDTILGGADADSIQGGDGADSIVGGDGNDTIFGENGSDIIVGGDGSDSIVGDGGSDVMWGGQGIDVMNGAAGEGTAAVDKLIVVGDLSGADPTKIELINTTLTGFLGYNPNLTVGYTTSDVASGGTLTFDASGNDELHAFGSVDLSGVTINGSYVLYTYSSLTLTQAQLALATQINIVGTSSHSLVVTDNAGTPLSAEDQQAEVESWLEQTGKQLGFTNGATRLTVATENYNFLASAGTFRNPGNQADTGEEINVPVPTGPGAGGAMAPGNPIGANPNTSNLIFDNNMNGFDDPLTINRRHFTIDTNDRFGNAQFISEFTPGTTVIPVPNTFTGIGDNRVHNRQFEVYYGEYDVRTGIFSVTDRAPFPLWNADTAAQKPYTLILYDNDTSTNVEWIEGLVFANHLTEQLWVLSNGGTANATLSYPESTGFILGRHPAIREDNPYDSTFGTDGANTINGTGSGKVDYLYGRGGNDTITGDGGGDFIIAGAGADVVTPGAGRNIVDLGDGTFNATRGDGDIDTLIINAVAGTSSDSERVVMPNTSVVWPNSGDDNGEDFVFNFEFARDIVRVVATNVADFNHATDVFIGTGGGISDGTAASFESSAGRVTGLIDLNGNGTIGSGDIAISFRDYQLGVAGDTFASRVQYVLTGTGGNDTIVGGDRNDTITGGAGADNLTGGGGADTINADAGADTITGGTGGDLIDLGNADGNVDTVVVDDGHTTTSVFANGGSTVGMDVITSMAIGDILDIGPNLNGTTVTYADNSTSYLSGAVAGVAVIRGNYNAGSQTFSYDDTANDYMVQWTNGGGTVSSVIAADYGTSGLGLTVGAGTLTAAAPPALGITLVSVSSLGITTQGDGPHRGYFTLGNTLPVRNDSATYYTQSTNIGASTDYTFALADISAANTVLREGHVAIQATNSGVNTYLDARVYVGGLTANDDTIVASLSYPGGVTPLTTLNFAIVYGNGGNDSITGSTGNDYLFGGDGNDTIEGGAGADAINAGSGANSITDAGQGADAITHDTVSSTVAIAVTGAGSVTLTASVAGATANSAAGVHTTVNASTSTAAVTLNGNTGNDSLTGGNGADTITGGTGIDSLTGGAGADRFIYTGTGNTGLTWATADIITDYERGSDKFVTGVLNGIDGRLTWMDGNNPNSPVDLTVAANANIDVALNALAAYFDTRPGPDKAVIAWNFYNTGDSIVLINSNMTDNVFGAGDTLIRLIGIDSIAELSLFDFIV